MTDPRGFLQIQRRVQPYRPVDERRHDYRDVNGPADEGLVREQAQRCMDCGVPFCHPGCPLGNLIPDWNDLVHRGHWRRAIERLHATNNFPEFTGKLCPAPCEEACVLSLNAEPVTIKQVEMGIIDHAWAEGWVTPHAPAPPTGRTIAVVGSGPAGLAAAQQLTRAGHEVTVFERDDELGGLLRYGIPDFKLEKWMIDRRLEQMRVEGTLFVTGVDVGTDLEASELRDEYDAVILATGAQEHRALDVPGAEVAGVHRAMEYLVQQNRRRAGRTVEGPEISCAGKRVAIIGGGDTSADCLGNAIREGATSVVEIAHGPVPPNDRQPLHTWPDWPFVLRTYAAHLEGGDRRWQWKPIAIEAKGGAVSGVRGQEVEYPGFAETGRRPAPIAVGEEVVLPVDIVLVAVGFSGIETTSAVYRAFGVELGSRPRVSVDGTFRTSVEGVFAAGDCVRGADLIVQAIADGREAARACDLHLQGSTTLPARSKTPYEHVA
jgi:glutamate synthase (NADPH/NADH) small chain